MFRTIMRMMIFKIINNNQKVKVKVKIKIKFKASQKANLKIIKIK